MNGSLISLTNESVLGAWDLLAAIKSFTSYGKAIGGALAGLIGVAILLVGLYHIFKKFTSNQPGGGESWGKIAAMVIVGGALMAGGGWLLYTEIAQGGNKTIKDAGTTGFMDPSFLLSFFG